MEHHKTGGKMTKPFEPADGVTPRWKKLFDLVRTKEVGSEVTYREAIAELGLSPSDRSRKIAQSAMRDAVAHLEKEGERTIGTRVNFGWVILDAQRELQQVDQRLVKTRRAAGRTVRGVQALNMRRDELSQFERERLDRTGRAAMMAREITGRHRPRMGELRKMIDDQAAEG
jgi:hypothetical protein